MVVEFLQLEWRKCLAGYPDLPARTVHCVQRTIPCSWLNSAYLGATDIATFPACLPGQGVRGQGTSIRRTILHSCKHTRPHSITYCLQSPHSRTTPIHQLRKRQISPSTPTPTSSQGRNSLIDHTIRIPQKNSNTTIITCYVIPGQSEGQSRSHIHPSKPSSFPFPLYSHPHLPLQSLPQFTPTHPNATPRASRRQKKEEERKWE